MTAAFEFEEWARTSRRAWSTQATRDETMNAYIHFLFRSGEPASTARMALYGFVHRESLTLKDPHEMHIARAALRGFGVAAPTTQRDPLPWEALVLIATFLASLTGPHGLGRRSCFGRGLRRIPQTFRSPRPPRTGCDGDGSSRGA